jgi:hypothetical protein
MSVAVALASCNSKKTSEKKKHLKTSSSIVYIDVPTGDDEFDVIYDFVQKKGRNNWPKDTSYFGDFTSEWQYRFTDEEGVQHAIIIMNEGIIMSAIIYENPADSQEQELAYVISKDDATVWIIDEPGKLLTKKQQIDAIKKDYKDLLAKAEE